MPPTDTDGSDGLDALSRVKEGNVANILAKLNAGKTVSKSELAMVEDYEREKAALSAAATNAATPAGEKRVADNMEAAAAMSGEDIDTIKRAKAAGCPAFKGSRVHVDELIAWLDANRESLPTGNSALDAINLDIQKEKLRKIRFANEVEEGRWIRREDWGTKLLNLGIEVKNTLVKKFEEELPDRQVQRSREEILAMNREAVDDICRQFQQGVKQWSRTSPK